MAIYKVTQMSDCGTYFQPYLQSVLIVANSKQEAEKVLQHWMDENGESFVKSKYGPEWDCYCEDVTSESAQVIDWTIDTDY